jgi:hypothetical protein
LYFKVLYNSIVICSLKLKDFQKIYKKIAALI